MELPKIQTPPTILLWLRPCARVKRVVDTELRFRSSY